MKNLLTKNINELNDLYKTKENEYKNVEKDCINKNLNWSEASQKLRPIATDMFEIKQEIRLKEDPEITFGREWKGELMTMNVFQDNVISGNINDNDGRGYYAIENGKSNIRIYPSDVLMNRTRSDFSHVIWFGK